MNLQPLSNHGPQRFQAAQSGSSVAGKHKTDSTEGTISADGSGKLEPADAPKIDQPKDASSKGQGVVRLLEAGHFKGVADVRLRINFAEQLADGAAGDGVAVAEHEAANLVGAVGDQVDVIVSGLGGDDAFVSAVGDLRSVFDSAVSDAVSTFAGNGDLEALSGSIQSAFGSLTDALRGLLDSTSGAPTISDSPTSGDASTVAAIDPVRIDTTEPVSGDSGTVAPAQATVVEPVSGTNTGDDPLAALLSSFNDALGTLRDAIAQASILPDPAPYSGNGAAYDKFLSIYNNLHGVEVDQTV